MKTEQEIRERLIKILGIQDHVECDMPIAEVRKWPSYFFMWVLDELEDDDTECYCQIHKKSYLGKTTIGCEICQIITKQQQKISEAILPKQKGDDKL